MPDYDPNVPAPEATEEPTPEQTAAEEKKAKDEADQAAIKDLAQAIHRGMNPEAPDDADVGPYLEFAEMFYWATNPPPAPEPPVEEVPPGEEAQAA